MRRSGHESREVYLYFSYVVIAEWDNGRTVAADKFPAHLVRIQAWEVLCLAINVDNPSYTSLLVQKDVNNILIFYSDNAGKSSLILVYSTYTVSGLTFLNKLGPLLR